MSNIDPKYWGSGLWKTMYSIAESLPEDPNNVSKIQIQNIKTFFKVLAEVIPCENCRTNYKSDIIRIQFPKSINNKTVGEWVVKINNSVNKKLNIPPVKYENIVKEISDYKTEMPNSLSKDTPEPQLQLPNIVQKNTVIVSPNKPKIHTKTNAIQSRHQRELRLKELNKRNIRKPVPKNTRLNRVVGSQVNPSQQARNGLNIKKPCNCGKKR